MKLENNLIVVTGASGYLGSSIIELLLKSKKNYKIIGVVRERDNDSYYSFLRDMKGAKERLVLYYGDLNNADYNKIFKDAYAIIHVASPFIYTSENPEKDIIQTAIMGNIRVLDACLKNQSTIKKVIITSSTAAMVDLEKKKPVYNEKDWNENSKYSNHYSYSKYLAERSVWEFKKNNKNLIKFDIVVTNPSFIIGPPVKNFPSLNTSLEVFKNTLLGIGDSKVTNRLHGIVDVRDVAKSHVDILELNRNFYSDRNLIVNRVISFNQMNEIVMELFPHLNISKVENTSNQNPHLYSLKSISKFKLKVTDFSKTLNDTVNYLIENNYLNQ